MHLQSAFSHRTCLGQRQIGQSSERFVADSKLIVLEQGSHSALCNRTCCEKYQIVWSSDRVIADTRCLVHCEHDRPDNAEDQPFLDRFHREKFRELVVWAMHMAIPGAKTQRNCIRCYCSSRAWPSALYRTPTMRCVSHISAKIRCTLLICRSLGSACSKCSQIHSTVVLCGAWQ